MRTVALLISALLVTATVLTGCGGGGQSSSSSTPASAATQSAPTQTSSPPPTARPAGDIVIANFAYTVPVSVRPGQQLTVVNNDDANHTVTADQSDLFDVRVSGGGGISTVTAPQAPGVYPFHCKYHADMHGTLTVA
jgi:plastocyanin